MFFRWPIDVCVWPLQGCLFLPLHLFNMVSHRIICALLCSPLVACVLLILYLFHTGMHLTAMSAVSSVVWCPHWEYSEKENLPHHHCQGRRCGTCSCCRHGMIGPAPVNRVKANSWACFTKWQVLSSQVKILVRITIMAGVCFTEQPMTVTRN